MNMKNLIHIFVSLLWCVLFITSCSKDSIELSPIDQFSEDVVWKDPALAESFVNNIYDNMDVSAPDVREAFPCLCDESHVWYNFNADFNNCLITPDNIPSYFPAIWDPQFKSIRACNVFLEKVDQVVFDNILTDGKTTKDRLIGEVHFLRAYYYYTLTTWYGGVPIITNAYELSDDFKAQRDTYADCIKFIADECDLAASLLPDVQSGKNKGRATKGAALALKSRVLLYAASDLHNTTVFPGYSNPELIGYTDGNRTAHWQAAKDAAKAVIDMGIYSLYKATPDPADSVAQNIVDYFLSRDMTSEDIFIKFYTALSYNNNTALTSGVSAWHCYGHNTPSGNLVDDYEMKDGTNFSWLNPTYATSPYKNREPRFYSTIFYEGAYWKPRPSDLTLIDPIGVIQVGFWQKWDNNTNTIITVPGLDTRMSSSDNWNACYGGYYYRKTLDPAINGQFFGSDVPLRLFRYGEILLNYAEACIELGQDAEARTYINMIRKRAGMPDVTESGAALRDRYRHERRIELAFEDHRIIDVRRWVIGPATYGPVYGVNVLYKLNPDHTTATVPTITPFLLETRHWINKAYFLPIMRIEMNKNDKLIQNPDY